MRSFTTTARIWLVFSLIQGILFRPIVGFAPTTRMTSGGSVRYLWSTKSNSRSKRYAFLTSPEGRSGRRRSFSAMKLFGQRKKRLLPRERQVPSVLRFFLGFVCKNNAECESTLQYLEFKKKNNIIESGVETALVLGDEKRRKQWIRDVSKQFSWIPSEILSACVDGLAAAFGAIAPRDLKNALRPGGLEKTRSKIEADVVRNLQRQPIIQKLPLPKEDKKKLLVHLVDLSLDFFLKDVESAMAAPSAKLQALDRERQELQKYMSFLQIAWYRLRCKPKSTLFVGVLSLWSVYATFVLCGQNYDMRFVTRQSKSFVSFLSGVYAHNLYNTKHFLLKIMTR